MTAECKVCKADTSIMVIAMKRNEGWYTVHEPAIFGCFACGDIYPVYFLGSGREPTFGMVKGTSSETGRNLGGWRFSTGGQT